MHRYTVSFSIAMLRYNSLSLVCSCAVHAKCINKLTASCAGSAKAESPLLTSSDAAGATGSSPAKTIINDEDDMPWEMNSDPEDNTAAASSTPAVGASG